MQSMVTTAVRTDKGVCREAQNALYVWLPRYLINEGESIEKPSGTSTGFIVNQTPQFFLGQEAETAALFHVESDPSSR